MDAATACSADLHPNAWRFDAGHVAKLELLPSDAPHGRPSNGQQDVIVRHLQVRLPVLERRGNGNRVKKPARKVVPKGYQLARDFRTGKKKGVAAVGR